MLAEERAPHLLPVGRLSGIRRRGVLTSHGSFRKIKYCGEVEDPRHMLFECLRLESYRFFVQLHISARIIEANLSSTDTWSTIGHTLVNIIRAKAREERISQATSLQWLSEKRPITRISLASAAEKPTGHQNTCLTTESFRRVLVDRSPTVPGGQNNIPVCMRHFAPPKKDYLVHNVSNKI